MWKEEVRQTKLCPRCGNIMYGEVVKSEWTQKEKIIWNCEQCELNLEGVWI